MAKISVADESKKYQLNKTDGLKLLYSFGLALTGVVVDLVADFVLKVDFGEWTPMVYAFTPVAVNVVRKFLAGRK